MKTVILAGGLGTRISEESHLKPKPMIEIGERPILWHIMKSYSAHGFNDFIICCGYRQYVIKEYFVNYYLHNSNITIDLSNGNSIEVHSNEAEPWRITLVDTGLNTMTGGRLKRVQEYLGDETFMLTYGDGVCDIDINYLLSAHKKNGKAATMTAIQPGGRFGQLDIGDDGTIHSFSEKRKEDGGWINGGFMVFEKEIFNHLENDETILERAPLENLAAKGQVFAYQYEGYWQCMDTLRDKLVLEELIQNGEAPWVKW